MKIRLSIAARERLFSKAMSRVRPRVQIVLDRIESHSMTYPTWDVVLLGVTDEFGSDHVEEIPNDDGVLQLIVGFPKGLDLSTKNDANIYLEMINRIRIAIRKSALTPTDCLAVEDILNIA